MIMLQRCLMADRVKFFQGLWAHGELAQSENARGCSISMCLYLVLCVLLLPLCLESAISDLLQIPPEL